VSSRHPAAGWQQGLRESFVVQLAAMSSGYNDSRKRRRGHSRSRSPGDRRDDRKGQGDRDRRRDDNEKRGDKKKDKDKKDKKRERGDAEDRSPRRKEKRSRSRNGDPVGSAGPAGGNGTGEVTLGRATSRGADLDAPLKQLSSWREEIGKEPMMTEDVEDDEAAVERTLSESRARREALIAKWVNRGEGQNGVENNDTPMGAEENSEDEEVSDNERPADAPEGEEKPTEEKLGRMKDLNKFILAQKAEHDDDMFNEEADEETLKAKKDLSQAIAHTGASADDWDDVEGYYKAKIGEVMDSRYLVVEDNCGKGVFSTVIKAKDQESNGMVAIKVMRCNDMMKQAAEKEIEVLERCNKADRANKKHVIRLLRRFDYRGHLCLVFECMWDNLRVALKKYTKDKGMSLHAVRSYAKQLLIGLRHVHKCQIIHADIKPDNILISAGHNVVKICDLGSGMDLIEAEVTPYLVSRFYRAPEIVLGKEYGVAIDTFALGATFYELFTGKILFPGKTNNDMLRLFMEYKGKIPHKVIKSGQFWKKHFEENFDFKYFDTNKATRKKITRVITDCSQKKSIVEQVLARVGPEKQKSETYDDRLYVKKAKQFSDMLEKMTAVDPDRRISAHDALSHPFLVEAFKQPTPKGSSAGKGGAAQKKSEK